MTKLQTRTVNCFIIGLLSLFISLGLILLGAIENELLMQFLLYFSGGLVSITSIIMALNPLKDE